MYTAWEEKPRKLGMIYCYQRRSSLFAVDITSLLQEMSGEGQGTELKHIKIMGNKQGEELSRSKASFVIMDNITVSQYLVYPTTFHLYVLVSCGILSLYHNLHALFHTPKKKKITGPHCLVQMVESWRFWEVGVTLSGHTMVPWHLRYYH